MAGPSIPCVWTGTAFEPIKRFHNIAAHHYGAGEVVTMVEQQERSEVSHSHEFAWLKEAWLNLPEQYAEQFPSPESLRKRLLITAGYYTETIIDAGSNAAALRVASYIRGEDQFAYVVVRGPLVVKRSARSQSRRAMDRAEFQASKTAIMEAAATLIGVTTAQLQQHAGQAA